MPHTAITDAAEVLTIQAGAVVSKVVHRDEDIDVTVFGFDAGPGFWLHMTAGTPHALEAVEPTLMLLTLVRPA
jgi:hypothetical protein